MREATVKADSRQARGSYMECIVRRSLVGGPTFVTRSCPQLPGHSGTTLRRTGFESGRGLALESLQVM